MLKAIQDLLIPYYKVVQGSFNQANLKFGETSGRQCACNTLFSIAWSVIRQVGLWHSSDLDFILNEGDEFYKGLHIGTFISADEYYPNALI